MQIHLGYAAFAAARSQVDDAIAELAEVRLRTSRQVGHLMDGGWSGAAADAFDEAWHGWLAAETQVREALERTESALTSTERDLIARDEGTVVRLATCARRYGGDTAVRGRSRPARRSRAHLRGR